MPIKRENGFLVTHDLGITPSLGIETERLYHPHLFHSFHDLSSGRAAGRPGRKLSSRLHDIPDFVVSIVNHGCTAHISMTCFPVTSQRDALPTKKESAETDGLARLSPRKRSLLVAYSTMASTASDWILPACSR
jgi:hypothetical protein